MKEGSPEMGSPAQAAKGSASADPPPSASASAATPPPTASPDLQTTSTPPPTSSTASPDADAAPTPTPAQEPTGVCASTGSQESHGRAEAAAAWRVDPAAAGSDEDDEKIAVWEKALYIGNLPGVREFDYATIEDRLTEALRSRIGQGAPLRLDIWECHPRMDGRRWARVVLYRKADVKTVLSLHDTFLCDRFVKVRQTPDYEIAGIGDEPPAYLANTTVCTNCGDFITQSELNTSLLASRAWQGPPNVCRKCGNARRVLKKLVQNRQHFYNKSTGDIVNHLRRRIAHPRHVHRRAYEKVCRYGQFCVRARKGTCWYAHDQFEHSIGNIIKFYIQNSHQPVRSAAVSFNPAAAEFTPAARKKEAEVRKAVSNITATAQQLRQLNLQRDMQSETLMQLAEECALTYQSIRQELLNRQKVEEAVAEEPAAIDAGRDGDNKNTDDDVVAKKVLLPGEEKEEEDTQKEPEGGEAAARTGAVAELQTMVY